MAWEQVVGEQIRAARENARITQEDLAKAIGMSRQSIIKYEAGLAKLWPDTLGKIAVRLGMTYVNVNGYRFVIEHSEETPSGETEQFCLDFDRERVFPNATIKISPTRTSITITATAAYRAA